MRKSGQWLGILYIVLVLFLMQAGFSFAFGATSEPESPIQESVNFESPGQESPGTGSPGMESPSLSGAEAVAIVLYADHQWAQEDLEVLTAAFDKHKIATQVVNVKNLPWSLDAWAFVLEDQVALIQEDHPDLPIVAVALGIPSDAVVEVAIRLPGLKGVQVVNPAARSVMESAVNRKKDQESAVGKSASLVDSYGKYYLLQLEVSRLKQYVGLADPLTKEIPAGGHVNRMDNWSTFEQAIQVVGFENNSDPLSSREVYQINRNLSQRLGRSQTFDYFNDKTPWERAAQSMGTWASALVKDQALPAGNFDPRVISLPDQPARWQLNPMWQLPTMIVLVFSLVMGGFFGMIRAGQDIADEDKTYLLDLLWFGLLLVLAGLMSGIFTGLIPPPSLLLQVVISVITWLWVFAGIVRVPYRLSGLVTGSIYLTWFVGVVFVAHYFGLFSLGWY